MRLELVHARGVDGGNRLPIAALKKLVVDEEAEWLRPLSAIGCCEFHLHSRAALSSWCSTGEASESADDDRHCQSSLLVGGCGTQCFPETRGLWAEGAHLIRILVLDPSLFCKPVME
jgi:hypothetical protein